MKNNSKSITANEINKYTYCPYQWYYERLHGKKEISEKYKKRNEALNLKNDEPSNFQKGIKFHDEYLNKNKAKTTFKIFLLFLIILAALFIYYFYFR